jgi:hypothetical protein
MSLPSAPQIVPRPLCRNEEITFYWQPPANTGGSSITSYTLYAPALSYSQSIPANQLSLTVTGFPNKVDYAFSLTATNSTGEGPPANFRTVQTGSVAYGSTYATASTLNENTAIISWDLSTIATQAQPKWIRIRGIPSTIGVSSFSWATYPSRFESIRTNLSTNCHYDFSVEAVNDVGYSFPPIFASTLFMPPPFLPTSLSGIATWLDGADASTITEDEGKVTVWADKSGFSRDAISIMPSIGPIYTANRLVFSGYDGMAAAIPFNWQHTLIMVATPQPTTTSTYYIMRNAGPGTHTPAIVTNPDFIGNDIVRSVEYLNVDDRATFVENPTPVFAVAYTYEQGNQVRGWYNGTNVFTISETQYDGSMAPYEIGSPYGDFRASMCEIISYNRLLTDGEMGQVMTYLMSKWGIA